MKETARKETQYTKQYKNNKKYERDSTEGDTIHKTIQKQ
jgi:hypothetical protein